MSEGEDAVTEAERILKQPQGSVNLAEPIKPEPEKGKGVTRRDAIKTGLKVLAGGVGGFIIGRASSGEPPRPGPGEPIFADRENKKDLRESLTGEQIARIKEAIVTCFNPPFQQLSDSVPTIDKTESDKSDIQVVERKYKNGQRSVGWWITGGTDHNKDLQIYCSAGLEADRRLSELSFYVDLKKTFNKDIVPDIDQYIDTSSKMAKIADKDLAAVNQQVFRVPDGLERKSTTTPEDARFSLYSVDYVPKVPFGSLGLVAENRTTYSYSVRGGLNGGAAELVIREPFYTPRQ